MRFISFLLRCLFATVSQAAGIKFAAIPASAEGPADMSRNADESVFVERPTDIERLID